MSGPTLEHSQPPDAVLAPAPALDPALPPSHSIHVRIPSDDMFPFPHAAASLSPSSPSLHDGTQQATRILKDFDAPMFDARTSSRSHFASASTESNLHNNTLGSGPVQALALNTRIAADGMYHSEQDDMSQYIAVQDAESQTFGAASAASPPSTATPSFQGSPTSWPPDLESSVPQPNNTSQSQLFPAFSELHHPQHDLRRTANPTSPGGHSPVGLDLMTSGFAGFGGLAGTEGDYFLSPWNPDGGNLFHMEPPRSPYEVGLGDEFSLASFSKDQELTQGHLQQLFGGSSQLPTHTDSSFPFAQGSTSPTFLPETPPPPPPQRLPFPIQSSEGQSPSPGIAPRELELPPGSTNGLTPSPVFSPMSASAPPNVTQPRWVQTAFDVPRSQALDIQQHTPSSPTVANSPGDMGFIPPHPFSTAPVPMPMPFSQTRHGYGQPYPRSRGHGHHGSPLPLTQMFQPASAPPHPGAGIHAHRSRVRTYSQRAGSALRDALRAEAFASGNASQSQPLSQGLPNNSNSNNSTAASLSLSAPFEDEHIGQRGGVGAVAGVIRQAIGSSGKMDVDEGMSSGTVRGSVLGIGGDASLPSLVGPMDTNATIRKKRRASARLTTTPSPRARVHSLPLPRDATPGSEGSVERERDPPTRSELRPPKLAPSTWQLYFTDWIQRHQSMHGGDKKLNVAQAAKEAGQEYAKLTPEQKEPFRRRSQAAKEQRERELADWQRTLTPEDIKRENAFRAAQRKAGKSRKGNIKDPNAPKKPLSAYFMFLQHIRSDAALVHDVFGDEKETTAQSVLAAEKWRSMTDEERKPFLARAEKEKLEYEAARRLYEDGSVGFESTISFNIPEPSGQEGALFVISGPPAEHGSDYEADTEGFITDEERHDRERPYRA